MNIKYLAKLANRYNQISDILFNNSLYLYKFAADINNIIKRIEQLGGSQDIIDYVKTLDEKYWGIVVGAVARDKDIALEAVQVLVNNKIRAKETAQSVGDKQPTTSKEEMAISQLCSKYSDYPELKSELERLSPKYLTWLDDRFGENATRRETHPIADCIPTLHLYQIKESSLKDKYKPDSLFKKLLDKKFPNRIWDNPVDITHLTADNMVKILELSESEAPKIEINPKNIEGDKVGKVGSWNLWLPSSRDNSIAIAQYDFDEDTQRYEPRTDWCTARIYKSNLFYNYIGGSGGKVMLFYIIKDNAQKSNNNDYLSLGFVNGKPKLPSEYGGISVDRANNGLTEEKLRSILGNSYDQIIAILTEKCNSLGGTSPAMKKVEEAAEDISKYKAMIAGNGLADRLPLNEHIAKITTSKEVLLAIVNNSNKADPNSENADEVNEIQSETLKSVMSNSAADDDVLMAIYNKGNQNVRSDLAENPKLSADLQYKLATDSSERVRGRLAKNPSLSVDLQDKLVTDSSRVVRGLLAKNPSLSAYVQDKLATDSSEAVRRYLTTNLNLSADVQAKLATDSSRLVRENLATNPSLSADLQDKLATDSSEFVVYSLATNPSLSAELQAKLAIDSNKDFRGYLATNPSLSADLQDKLANDSSEAVRVYLATNLNLSADVQAKLATDSSEDVRGYLANNPKLSAEARVILEGRLATQASRIDYIYKQANNYYMMSKYN